MSIVGVLMHKRDNSLKLPYRYWREAEAMRRKLQYRIMRWALQDRDRRWFAYAIGYDASLQRLGKIIRGKRDARQD
jgi:hypothetical protein